MYVLFYINFCKFCKLVYLKIAFDALFPSVYFYNVIEYIVATLVSIY